jgi:hypothetical protein
MHTGTRSVSLLWNDPCHLHIYPGLADLDFVVTHLPHERDLLLLTVPGREQPLAVWVVRVTHHLAPQFVHPKCKCPKPCTQTDAVHHVDIYVEPDPMMLLDEPPVPPAITAHQCTADPGASCKCGAQGCPGF